MQCRPSPDVVRNMEHYQRCPACKEAASLNVRKIQHVIDHLPRECELAELTDSQYLSLFIKTYRSGKSGRNFLEHELDVDDFIAGIAARGLGNELARLLGQERAMILRQARAQEKKRGR